MLPASETCIIVGAGSGLSASLARLFRAEEMTVVLAARNIEKLAELSKEIDCELVQCDSSNVEQVIDLYSKTDEDFNIDNIKEYYENLVNKFFKNTKLKW